MENAEGGNQTPIVELILVGFGNGPELQPLLFLLFLVIYLVAVAGNLLIVVLVVADRHLHTPMYYFVANLSSVEICYVSTTLPRLLASLVTGHRNISLQNCIVQFHFYVILSTAECQLLTAMCCDRYLAICHPLRYPALMNGRVCCHMVAWAWIIAILYSIMLEMLILQLTYCGPKEFDHFFCDFAPINPFCGNADILAMGTNYVSIILTIMNFLLSLASYTCIIISILRINSSTGRQKAFSTCSSHLIVVAVYNVCIIITYVVPEFNPPPLLYKTLSVLYGILVPLLNPVLYSLRNKEVNQALRTAIEKLAAFRHRHGV
ncbi:olfactory receptor 10C1-like [Pelodiscus sinensis]|nr:olfactory receptor 10C1-like [Pelodiscus sinensis]|eukprot:XP_006110434.1 olfactory receptor 10C1-like [Pelodiscus sinensis]